MRELRAIWYNLPVWDEHSTNPLEVSKAEWRSGFKSKLDNQVYKMHAGNLPEHLKINPDYEVSFTISTLNLCGGFEVFARRLVFCYVNLHVVSHYVTFSL